MRVNFSEINREDFQVQERDLSGYGSVVLITPSFTKHKWSDSDRHLRSVLCDSDGRVISSGFPKFHNYGEVPELDLLTAEAILDGRSVFPEKMDGSLLIRSVINGQVHFRTRGSHTLVDQFETNVLELVRQKYPRLLDPTLDSRYSVLFEYTGPENQIVIQYEESELIALGVMDLSAEPPEFVSSPILVRDLQRTYGTPGVRFHNLGGSLSEIIETIRSWKGAEGIVVWNTLKDGRMLLCKIKAMEYIKIHTLKFQMNEARIRDFCWYRNINGLEDLKQELFRYGVDWEGVSFMAPVVEQYLSDRVANAIRVRDFLNRVNAEKLANLSRKEAAIRLKEMSQQDPPMFQLGIEYLFGAGMLQNYIDALTLGVPVKQLENVRKATNELVEGLRNRSYTQDND